VHQKTGWIKEREKEKVRRVKTPDGPPTPKGKKGGEWVGCRIKDGGEMKLEEGRGKDAGSWGS